MNKVLQNNGELQASIRAKLASIEASVKEAE